MKRQTWKDIDWVLLGTLGWDIDWTGAGYYGLRAGVGALGSVGNKGCHPDAHIHIDLTTLHIMGFADAGFLLERLRELRAAGLDMPPILNQNWNATVTAGTGAAVTAVAWNR